MSCWQTEHVLQQTWLGDDASPVDINDFTPVRSTVGICWDEDMELRWTKRVSRDWKVQWHPLAGMIRNETILTRANWWNLNEFDVYCTMVSIYFYLSTWIFKSKGSSWQAKEKLANQSSEEESKSTADKDVEEDEWSLEHVLESSRFRLRLTLICNSFFCNFFYMFVQFAAITVVPPM